jgi:hypothetical protein
LAGFLTISLFYGDAVVNPMPQPPTWRTRVSLFVWVITFDLSSMGGPTSSSQDHLTNYINVRDILIECSACDFIENYFSATYEFKENKTTLKFLIPNGHNRFTVRRGYTLLHKKYVLPCTINRTV